MTLSVVTHQPAGIEDFCIREGIALKRIAEPRKQAFSRQAADWLLDRGTDFAVLFLDRLLSEPFIDRIHTINFHPALLPAFPGTNAIQRALDAKVGYLGATAHQATMETDAGPILCQSAYALSPDDHELARMLDISFVQRLALLCNVVDGQLAASPRFRGWATPEHPIACGGSAFVAPSWLTSPSRELILEQARRRSMTISI